jgi:hypothetical protein
MRILAMLSLSLLISAGLIQISNTPEASSSDRVGAPGEVATNPPPRLRRLHLVRPDLIYYPLPSEYLC